MSKQTWKPGNMLYPVPAVMVSVAAPGEKPNIITVAWAGTINSDPPMLSISVRKECYSHDIIEKTGEFVVNLVNEPLTRATDFCGVRSGRDVDKFKEMRLTPESADIVKCPMIAQSPINLECRVIEVKSFPTHDMFIADVLNVIADDRYINPETGAFDMQAAHLMAYCHGQYFKLGEAIGRFGWSVKKK